MVEDVEAFGAELEPRVRSAKEKFLKTGRSIVAKPGPRMGVAAFVAKLAWIAFLSGRFCAGSEAALGLQGSSTKMR